jgi:hypothetical protein
MRLINQKFAKIQNLCTFTRTGKNTGVSRCTKQAAQHLRRDPVARTSINDFRQPLVTRCVVNGIGAEGVHQHIDVGKNHRSSIRSSRSPLRLRSTPGSVPPRIFEIGSFTRIRREDFELASTIFNPSSKSEVRVRPSSAAFLFALRRSSSDNLIVVRICLIIASICLSQTKGEYSPALPRAKPLALRV